MNGKKERKQRSVREGRRRGEKKIEGENGELKGAEERKQKRFEARMRGEELD